MVFGFCGYAEISKFNPQMRYFLENVNFWDFLIWPYLGVWPRKLNITKMSLPDVNSICLNGCQKYNAYLSHAFSRKNLPYWLMCRKTRIFAILENMGHFQNWVSLQISQYGSEWESQLAWSPRRGSRQNHHIIIWKYRFYIFVEIFVDIYVRIHFVSIILGEYFKTEIFKI